MPVKRLVFRTEETANMLVAGIPAAARAVALLQDGTDSVTVAVPGGWRPTAWCRAEMARLAPGVAVEATGRDIAEDGRAEDGRIVGGEEMLLARHVPGMAPPVDPHAWPQALAAVGDAILKATIKPGDGVVARHVNRPLSQAISRRLLRVPGMVPLYATFGTMACGILMVLALFFGGPVGLILGAFLFQAASVIDGVDGEIARATGRASVRGAMLDSVTDATINVFFIGGLAFNLWQQGYERTAAAGALALVLLLTGLFLIGRRARANGGPFTFDGVKSRMKGSRIGQWLTWLTMRDFFAAAAAVLAPFGFGDEFLIIFSTIAVGWFVVTVFVLWRPAGVLLPPDA